VGSAVTTYVYDSGGQLTAEYGPAVASGTEYLLSDTLGSTRLVLDGTGAVKERIDYLPFGEELSVPYGGRAAPYTNFVYPANPDIASEKFTGKERDAATGLDFFGARYMSTAQGRFSSIDPAFESESVDDPQSWNRYAYAYVYNRPLTLTDPDGRCPQCLPALAVGAVGAVIAGGATAFSEWYTTDDFSWRDVGAAGAGGFVSAGLPVLTLGTSLIAEAGFGTVVAVGAGSNVVAC
jgi:RHS repeat-associated protein